MPRRLAEPADEDLGLSGEARLVLALLRQSLADLRSPRYRTEARQFLTDERAIRFWLHLIGLDSDRFRAHAQQALRQMRET